MIRDIDKTLADQMQISEREIEKRKCLLSFTDQDVELLVSCRQVIAERVNRLVDEFYARQTEIPDISLLIGDAETLSRLSNAMRRYVMELFDGFYDADYVNRRLRIGKVHNRIGVSPKLYIAAIYQLQSLLNRELRAAFPDDRLDTRLDALNKLMLFDTQLIFDTYIASMVAEVEAARTEAEQYAASLEEKIAERTRQLRELSRRDMLTELYNQRGFFEHLHHEMTAAERRVEPISLAYLDLNGFKQLNDSLGHKQGDRMLAQIGKVLREATRETDIVARYGGDEFCLLMPNTSVEAAREVCERLVKRFRAENDTVVSFSIGIVQDGPETFHDTDWLVQEADRLMYVSKLKANESPDHYITCG